MDSPLLNPMSITPGNGFENNTGVLNAASYEDNEAQKGLIESGQASVLYGANNSEEILARLTKKNPKSAESPSSAASASVKAAAQANI